MKVTNRAKIILFTLTMIMSSVTFSDESIIGAPNENCNCESPSQVDKVISAMSKTDTIVPIDLYYKFKKLGSADLSIKHVDKKIISVTINGRVNAFGVKESMTETIDIESLQSGNEINYHSNDSETPVVIVSPKEIKINGGSVDLKVKMKDGYKIIPLKISLEGDKFIASTSQGKINSLRIYLDFSMGASLNQQSIVGGFVSKYKID